MLSVETPFCRTLPILDYPKQRGADKTFYIGSKIMLTHCPVSVPTCPPIQLLLTLPDPTHTSELPVKLLQTNVEVQKQKFEVKLKVALRSEND